MPLPNLLPALNHCLSKFIWQGTGLEKLELKSGIFEHVHLKGFFTQVRDLSHSSDTILVLSNVFISLNFRNAQMKILLQDLSEEFQGKKTKRIKTVYSSPPDYDKEPHLRLIADEVVLCIEGV